MQLTSRLPLDPGDSTHLDQASYELFRPILSFYSDQNDSAIKHSIRSCLGVSQA